MVKEKATAPKTLSSYPLADQPLGSSVPYVPQARPWNSRTLNAPSLGEGRDPSERIGTGLSKSDIEGRSKELEDKDVKPVFDQRPTASVTDIPGAAASAKRLDGIGSFKNPGRSIKMGAMQRGKLHIQKGDEAFLEGEDHLQHFTFPAILWCCVGTCLFPPALCCGFRFTSSANSVAKGFGWASIFILCLYVAGALIVMAQLFFASGWNQSDPGCLRYVMSELDFTKNDYGGATPILGLAGPGLAVTSNVSILQVDCAFMAQVVIDADEATKLDRTLVVRINTPGTLGDNFGLYVRDRNKKINPSSDSAPAKAWFEFARPQMSNPQANGQRGPCLRGMCDGVYQNSLPSLAGSMWEARVPLGWYKYFIAIAVVANDPLALERPFCMDTCLLPNIPSAGVIPKTSKDPCAGQEMTSCKAAIDRGCVFAKTREACLGINTRRRTKKNAVE